MKTFLTTAAMTAFLATSASAVVVNGSFELDPGEPGLNGSNFADMPGSTGGGSWDIWTAIPGWKTVEGAGIEIQTNNTLGVIDAQDGDYYVELDSNNNSSMVQEIMLGVGSYELSFWFSPRQRDTGTNGIDYFLGSPAASLVDGNVTGPTADFPRGEWTQVTSLFRVETAGSYFLGFEASGRSDSLGGLIDNVSVAPVPVPAAGLLLLTALGGAAALRRRKG